MHDILLHSELNRLRINRNRFYQHKCLEAIQIQYKHYIYSL